MNNKKKQIANQQTIDNNNKIKAILQYDYDNDIVFNGERHTHIKTKALLLSPTRFLSNFVDPNFARIPKDILEIARIEGVETMRALEYTFKNNVKDLAKVPFLSEKIKLIFYTLINCFIDNKWKIKAVEKHISNGYWHCYVDAIIRDQHCNLIFIEIKTRSNNDIRLADKMQLVLNMKIANLNYYGYVVVINKKSFEYKVYRITFREVERILNMFFRIFKELELNNYILSNSIK